MKLTFPHMGNTFITAKVLLDELGMDYVIPPFNNKKALEIGTKYAPELACLPLKINLGNFIQAHEKGADTILISGGCGPCRFGYYSEMHREILMDMGLDMEIIALEWPDKGLPEFLRRVRKIAGGCNLYRMMNALIKATRIAKEVDNLERLSFKIRPRERMKGSTDRIYRSFQSKVEKAEGYIGVKRLLADTEQEFKKLELDGEICPLKVGIVGEIYSSIDPFTNFDIASKLGQAGVEVSREVTVSGWLVDHMLKPLLGLPRDLRYKKAAEPYLGTMIGGHAQETIGHTILHARAGYDGVVQIFPLTCMPEIVAESILPAIEQDFDISVLTLIIDEMSGEAGYMTRLEAFVDLLKRKKELQGHNSFKEVKVQ